MRGGCSSGRETVACLGYVVWERLAGGGVAGVSGGGDALLERPRTRPAPASLRLRGVSEPKLGGEYDCADAPADQGETGE